MANYLKMSEIEWIKGLLKAGWSFRRIARELNIHRETVSRHAKRATVAGFEVTAESVAEPANVTTGFDEPSVAKPAIVTAGSKSLCAAYQMLIEQKLEAGLSAQRIFQDISAEVGFAGSYESVKRYVRFLEAITPLPFCRMECEAGEEAQVDFGTGAWIIDGDSKRRSHVFRIVLSHSRKGYSEAVYRQDTETFIRCLENAFRAWGGIPKTLVIDNLKAAVTNADWYDPELNPKIVEFARHYGTVILPTRPYTPWHKGKVEGGVKYVKNNALKGRTFKSLAEENEHLRHWERQVADTRIHGTTKRQVGTFFTEAEKTALIPLPLESFPLYQEAKRTVQRDGYVAVDKAFYSAPPEYVGQHVWARWDSRLVRLFNQKFEQIAVHAVSMRGKFSTRPEHIASKKRSIIEQGAVFLVKRVSNIGPDSGAWAQEVIVARGAEGMRCLQGFIALASKYTPETLNKAAGQGLKAGLVHLKPIRRLCERYAGENGAANEFLSEHPVIRPMTAYQQHIFKEGSTDDLKPSPDKIAQTAPAVGTGGHAGGPSAGGGQFQP